MRSHRTAALSISLLSLSFMPALPQQTAQPQFKSSELQVTVNRAKRTAAVLATLAGIQEHQPGERRGLRHRRRCPIIGYRRDRQYSGRQRLADLHN